MKGTKFFGIGIALAVCVLALILAAEAGFISVAWAGKPPKPQPPKYGYAKLQDGDGDVIKSDGGQYIDKHIVGGEDQVEIQTYDTGAFYESCTFMGEVENQSTRKVNFLFDFLKDAVTKPGEGQAVYDILVWTDGTRNSRRGNLIVSKYCFNDGTVHAPVIVHEDGTGRVQFVIDPDWNGTSTNAVTQKTVNAFYGNDTDVSYWVNDYGHIIYSLYYDDGFDINSESGKWTFTAKSGGKGVRLCVGKLSGRKGGAHEIVTLATYNYLPFQLTVSTGPLLAPGKYNTLSTTWGKIK